MNLSLFGDSTVRRTTPSEGELFVAVLSDTRVDLSRVRAPGVVRLKVVAVLGDVRILVPPGSTVELAGLSLVGDRTFKPQRTRQEAADGLTLHLTGIALLGDIEVVETEA